ncbi:MAG TPA: TonB-dependent receptor [Steroidobacteraceae bacterium]|nr:TonB-dependent receptor [Steroidobacteraceae bacterium]
MREAVSSPEPRAAGPNPLALITATAALLLALHPRAASAADEAAAAPTSASPLEEVVVTATRREESLSKVAVSVTAITQEGLDLRGIKDIQDVARFTPGIKVDNSGTNNISIRGIASSGGAGTTGIYIDDTPIQMRALAFNPDEALPKSFDIDRVEVLRGPQGTLFGAGSMGGTVRYITTQPSLHKDSVYSREEISFTQGGDPSYEAGIAAGGPLIDGTFGVRVTAWYRKDGGWIDRINPDTLALEDKRANHAETSLFRLAAIWAPSSTWTLTPSFYYQNEKKNDVDNYWTLYSDPSSHHFVSANPTQRYSPDKLYMPSLKIEADFEKVHFISSTAYYHRDDLTGYDGTLYNLGFYQSFFPFDLPVPLLDGTGVHLNDPAYNPPGGPGIVGYRSPATVNNGQRNFTQEFRLQSVDDSAALTWTAGLFYSVNKQRYLEEIHDPQLGQFLQAIYTDTGNSLGPTATPNDYILDYFSPSPGFDPGYPTDSYFLLTHAKDEQIALFGEASYKFSDRTKLTVGGRYARMKFDFDSITGGPQIYDENASRANSKTENAFTPKVSLQFQADPSDMYYATYSKGFRPGGGNNPLPTVACATDFDPDHLDLPNGAPATFNSDTVDSFEVGAKNNFNNRFKLASSIYYIKWHNIQQTVVPPVCQISFIANLGEATAKGIDLQADVAVTDNFTMELTTGYTDARYTRDSQISPNPDVQPIVAKGDAISGQGGQPNAPFTASVGLEYKFNAFSKDSFVRLDYEHTGAPKWLSASQDSATGQYNAANYELPATNFLTLRGGVTLGEWQVAAFIDNLADTHVVTNYDFTIVPGDPTVLADALNTVQRNYTFRPRTFGLTFTYRK